MARRKKGDPPTLSQVAVANAGFRQALLAMHFMMGWGMLKAKVGREPLNVEEYAETFDFDRATAYRHRAAFLKAFPGEVNPSRLNTAAGLDEVYEDLVRGVLDLAEGYRNAKATVFSIGSAKFVAT